MRLRAWVAGLAIVVAGCSAPPRPDLPSCTNGWQPVAAALRPAVIAAGGDRLLVGGSTPTGTNGEFAPALTTAGGPVIPLTPQSAYGKLAELVLVATDGSRVAAMGTVTGGAHLNPRRTVWIGTTAGLVEEPQPVETFGGPDAGGMTALALDSTGPLLLGSWSQPDGSVGGALWTRSGHTWARNPTAAALAGSAGNRFLPTGLALDGSRIVVSGFLVVGTQLHAAVLVGDRAGDWRRMVLDTTDSVATGVGCAAGTCWLSGRLGGSLAVWRLVGTGATQLTGVPQVAIDGGVDSPSVTAGGATLTVLVDRPAGADTLLQNNSGVWKSVATPGGAHQVVAHGDRLTVLTGSGQTARVWTSC